MIDQLESQLILPLKEDLFGGDICDNHFRSYPVRMSNSYHYDNVAPLSPNNSSNYI